MDRYIKEQKLELSERFLVYDGTEQKICYHVIKKIPAVKDELCIYDSMHECVAIIKQKSVHALSAYQLLINGEEYHIKQKFHFFNVHIRIEENGWEMKGNIALHEYKIYHLQRLVAEISQKWISFGNIYHIHYMNQADEMLVLCMVLTVDSIERCRKK